MKFELFKEFDPTERLYCNIAAAVLGAGALSAGASIWGANKAADAQTTMGNAAIANQKDMFAQNKNLLSPFISAGADAINPLKDWLSSTGSAGMSQLQDWLSPTGGAGGNNALSSLLKMVTPGADMSATLEKLPGYQFQVGQGTRAAMNALAARGLGGSPGAIAKGVGGYVTGLADSTWGNLTDKLQGAFTSGAGALQNMFSSGSNALQSLIGTGVNAGGALAGVGANSANQVGNNLVGIGNAQAAGANATGAAVGGIGNSITTAQLLRQLTGGGGGGNSIYGQQPGYGNFGELSPYSPMNA